MDRRSFLGGVAASAATLLTPRASLPAASPMRILVLGGTNFLGPAIVEDAIAMGHEVTLLNRGITRPYLFPDIEKLRGDRREGLRGLRALGSGRTWDAVIDVWPADAAMTETAARFLAERADYYGFVSSIAVYRSFSKPWITETAALRLDDAGYGGEKSRAEKAVEEIFPNSFGVARCPSIFGPRDPGSTLHYWLRNFHTSNHVLAPGTGKDPLQFVDVRDVARWVVDSATQKRHGIFNTSAMPLQFANFVAACRDATDSAADITWASKEFLYANDVEAFSQMPLWVPVEEDPGFFQIRSAKARDSGFETRQPERSIADAWRWYQSSFFDDTTFPHNGWGISKERQEELLTRWKMQTRASAPGQRLQTAATT